MKKFILTLVFCLISPFVFAEIQATLNFPSGITTEQDKITYAYQSQEALRLLHNKKGNDYKEEIITKEEWLEWKEEYFKPRSTAICVEIVKYKTILKQGNFYEVDLDSDFSITP